MANDLKQANFVLEIFYNIQKQTRGKKNCKMSKFRKQNGFRAIKIS